VSKKDKKKKKDVTSTRASTAGRQDAGDGPGNGDRFQQTCLSRLEESVQQQGHLAKRVQDLEKQGAALGQGMGQLYDAVRQLYDAVSAQCRQLLASDQALQQELQRFQTGGPQRAMAGVFHKLFRDLVQHVSQMDALVTAGEAESHSETEAAWLNSLRLARDGFESILGQWGCSPIPVEVGKEEFNPEIHESVNADPGETVESAQENVIVKVRRRGWALHGYVLVPPQVVVG